MFTEHTYGYASLRTGLKKSELMANFQNTKLYHDYLDIVSILHDCFFAIPDDEEIPDTDLIEKNMVFNPQKTLQIDVMTSARKGMHYKLDHIIKQAEREQLPYGTIITITSISSFGNCNSIKKYYRIFREKKIGVLFPDYTRESALSEYSTCNFVFKPRPQPEYDRAFELIESLEEGNIPDKRGRIGKDYTPAFRVAFWLYELFKISEKIAVAMSGYSKNGFHLKASNYEQTVYYKWELETFEENFSISKLIKRNRPVPENFDKLIHTYEKNGDLELTCILNKIPMIFPIDYTRLFLKYEGGRKQLTRCLKLYDFELMDRFEEWESSGNEPSEFYKECGIEQYLYNN